MKGKRILLGLLCCLFLVPSYAQTTSEYEEYMAYQQQKDAESKQKAKQERKKKKDTQVFSGFSGGMLLHGGYGFSSNPKELFQNGSLDQVKSLPKDGVILGIGGAARIHLLKHLHIGAEGGVSIMPLQSSGSQVRTGWGGALVDVYWDLGKCSFFLGGLIGGGKMRRLYVPDTKIEAHTSDDPTTVYNASSTQSSFFMLDPYIGLEWACTNVFHLLFKVDYLLPFGKSNSLWKQDLSMSNFLTPTGPRLYIGFMFNHSRKDK
ncbi:MAG: hypothetical protein IJR74_06200 [Paludibacteraceae bacterium]|nr:hypothetical protein [Paludibacteraceae bacterium]